MEEEKEKIDLLFEKNADEQLGRVDWEGLGAAISARLDKAERSKTAARKYSTAFRTAAAIVGAAAVIVIALIIKTGKEAQMPLGSGRAVVRILEARGSAAVEIKRPYRKAQVTVDIGPAERKIARCEVKITNLNGEFKKEETRAAWIIISRPAPMFVDNGASKDEADLVCML